MKMPKAAPWVALGFAALFFLSVPVALAQTVTQSVPTITSINPGSGQIGTQVIIYGTNFSSSEVVIFGSGANAGVIVGQDPGSDASRIIFTMPTLVLPICSLSNPPCSATGYTPLPGTYPVSVSDLGSGVTSNSFFFTLNPSTVITGISPGSGQIGTEVTITGSGFSPIGNAIVLNPTPPVMSLAYIFQAGYINSLGGGVVAQLGNGTSVIKFLVPTKLIPRCEISLTPCSNSPFDIFPGGWGIKVVPGFNFNLMSNTSTFVLMSGTAPPLVPTITSISPLSGTVGTQVTIKGSGFSPNFNVIDFGSGVAPAQVSGNDLVFSVPTQSVPRCTVFGNPPCQPTPTQLVPGVYNIDVALDATTISNPVQFTVNPIPVPTTTVPAPVQTTGAVQATANLNVRSAPSLSASIVGIEPVGSAGGILSGPVNANGYDWMEIVWQDGLVGWSVQNYLAAQGVSPCPLAVGDKVDVVAGGSALVLYMRSGPSVTSTISGGELDGSEGIVSGGPVTAGGYNWWHVGFSDGISGWAIENDLTDITCIVVPTFTPPPPPPPAPPPPPSTLAAPINVSFVTPQNGATVSGIVNVAVAATSTDTITAVYLYKDSTLLGVANSAPYSFAWDTTKEYNGSHSLRAIALTALSSAATSITVTVTGGLNLPPTVSIGANPVSVSLNGTSQISWNSSNATSCSGSGTNGSTATSGGPWTTPALTTSTTYQITCTGPGGTSAAAVTVTISTPPPPPPPPTLAAPINVSFVTPQNGATVSGIVSVLVSATSIDGITAVYLYKNGNVFMGVSNSAPYSFTWDTSKEFDGPYTLQAIAFTPNASAVAGITVNVTGGLSITLSFTTPQAGATVFGTIPVTVNVTANTPISEVDLYVDGKRLSTLSTAPYTANWDTTQVVSGVHSLSATAKATIGVSVSQSISVSVIPPPLFSVGDRVTAQTGSNLGLNVRSGPSTNYPIIATEPNGSLGTIVISPPISDGTYSWYKVQWDSGALGWSAESYLAHYP